MCVEEASRREEEGGGGGGERKEEEEEVVLWVTVSQWGTRAPLMSPTADGKTLLVWREVFVLMDRSLLP